MLFNRTRPISIIRVVGLVSALTLAPTPALASLIGDQILGTMNLMAGASNLNLFDPNTPRGTLPVPATVGSAVEFQFGDTLATATADFDASTLSVNMITNFPQDPLNDLLEIRMLFEDLNWTDVPGILTDFMFVNSDFPSNTTITVFPPGSLPGVVDNDDIGLSIDLISSQFLVGGNFTANFDIIAMHAPIPEPGTLLLIGSGLMGIGVGARRRNKK